MPSVYDKGLLVEYRFMPDDPRDAREQDLLQKLFDRSFYLERNPDVAALYLSPGGAGIISMREQYEHWPDFMERIGDSDRASEFDSMSVDEYAEGKGLRLSNPTRKRKRRAPAMANGFSKSDLEDMTDRAIDVLDDAYDPAASREDLANAVGSALDILRGEDEDSDEDSSDSDSDED